MNLGTAIMKCGNSATVSLVHSSPRNISFFFKIKNASCRQICLLKLSLIALLVSQRLFSSIANEQTRSLFAGQTLVAFIQIEQKICLAVTFIMNTTCDIILLRVCFLKI